MARKISTSGDVARICDALAPPADKATPKIKGMIPNGGTGRKNVNPTELRAFAGRYAQAWCSGNPEKVAAFFSENGLLRVNDGAAA